VSYVRQDRPRGLGHAVLCGADHVGDEPFAVMLGDDLISSDDRLLARMIAARERYGGSIVALMEVPSDQISLYGVAAFKPTDESDIVAVTDLVEKPETSEAPSNWIVIGRYICDPAIFSVLRETPPGRGGEIQLTDALCLLVKEQGLWAYIYDGVSYDAGDKLGFLKATVEIALQNPELGAAFRDYLKTLKL
jgi:UTP--glucose-1-phosphate uridylyltransferase